jgi:hypothetical protein
MDDQIYLTAEFMKRQDDDVVHKKLENLVSKLEVQHGRGLFIACNKDKEIEVREAIIELSGIHIKRRASWKFIGNELVTFPITVQYIFKDKGFWHAKEVFNLDELMLIADDNNVQCIYQQYRAVVC